MDTLSHQIWDMKYRLKRSDGTPVDVTVDDSWNRVALAAAAAERPETRSHWHAAFKGALADHRFLPAGRILAGAGTGRAVTLFNCFVMGTIPDDLSGIFAHLREAALTMQQGGGIGYDFSTLRPKGAEVRGVGADASGPVSFMDVWDSMCRTIMSAGARRGAMMGTLSCAHPDIEDFIEAKRAPDRLRNFNLSVLVTDAFMAKVEAGQPWDLVFEGKVYKTVSAPRAVGPDHARDLRFGRAGRDLHRSGERAEQPRLLRDDPGDQSLRRAAAAALWRVPPGLGQSGEAGEPSVHG